jgi:hypothetical protein
MPNPAHWNDLDRALAAFLRSPSAMPELLRQLAAAEELHSLMPYHPELPGGMMQLKKGVEFPFIHFNGKQGEVVVPIFSSEERAEEGLQRGKVPENTYALASLPALQMLEVIGVMNFHAELNKSCQPGSFTLPPDLLRDLVSGAVFKPEDEDGPTEERRFLFIDPADYPTEILQPVFEVLRRHANFRAVWIFGSTEPPDKPGRTRYELLVLTDPRDPAIFHELNLVAQNTGSQTGEVHLGHVPRDAPEELEAFMEQAPPPFYAAPDFKTKPII